MSEQHHNKSEGRSLCLSRCVSRAAICCLLFGLLAQFFPANATVSAYRYRGGSGDGWDSQQASPGLYQGGNYDGSSMAASTNITLGNISIYPETLRFVGQPPATSVIGIAFSWLPAETPLSVEVLDNSGRRYSNTVYTITLSLDNDPAGGTTLGGTLTANTLNGLASFEHAGLYLDKAGVGFTLEAASADLVPGISDGFTVLNPFTVTSPAASTNWAIGRQYNVEWTTHASASQVLLYYAIIPNYNNWYPINILPVANNGSYLVTIPNILPEPQTVPYMNLAIKVADAANLLSYGLSGSFTISLYKITFNITDYYNGLALSDLSVECSSGWTASGLASGVSRYYAYSTYTTRWSKDDYFSGTLTEWTANSNKTVNMTLSQAMPTYRVMANFTHEGADYLINAWLEESGRIITNCGTCRVTFEDKDSIAVDVNGASPGTDVTQTAPNANGYYRLPIDMANINSNRTYFAKVEVEMNGMYYSTSLAYGQAAQGGGITGLTADDLTGLYEDHAAIRSNLMYLGVSYDALYSSVGPNLGTKVDDLASATAFLDTKLDGTLAGIDLLKEAVGASQSETLYSKALATLEAATNLPSAITREAKKGIQSKIINRPTSATNGAMVMIRYRTDTGKAPEISVYDPGNTALVSGGMMTNEIGTSGVYEYGLQIQTAWPMGEYTILCSESTTASADSMILKIVAADGGGAGAAVDLSTVIEKLDALSAKLDTIATDQSTMNSTLSSQSSTLSTMSGDMTTMSGNINTIKTDVTAINSTLKTMSENINTLLDNWNSANLSDINTKIDQLVKYMGTPFDSGGMQTLFGKIAQTYGVINQLPAAAIFVEVQALRKEVDFQGKSSTAYNMLADISAALEDLQDTGTDKTKETATSELQQASKTVQETREALGAIAKQAGVSGVLAASSASGGASSLQNLYDQMTELKAMSQAILDLLRQREKPVVKSWLESGSVKRRILVANHSKAVEEVVPVKEYLPDGVKPEDIISKGDFKLGYDFDRSLYFVYQDVKLQPGASVTLEIVMTDIWRVDVGEIAMLRDHVRRLSSILDKSRYAEQVKVLRDNIDRRLDQIAQVQNTVTTTENRLSNYEVNKASLEEIKNDIGTLEDLVVEVQGVPTEKVMGKTSPLVSAAAGAATGGASPPPKRKITMKIEMVNPLVISNTAPLEYALPAEIKPDLIVEQGGLEVRYNPEKKLHYLSKENLVFAPHEKKSFSVELNDIWYIPNQQINDLRGHTEKLVGMFVDSEARQSADFLGNRIMQELTAIDKSQQQADLTADVHIGNYRVNAKRLEDIKKDIARLERLIVQTGGSPGLTMAARDVKIKEGGVIPAAGSKAKALITVNTWRIIWTIIAFTGVISFLFFMIWWMQIRKKEAEKLEKLDLAGKDGKNEKS